MREKYAKYIIGCWFNHESVKREFETALKRGTQIKIITEGDIPDWYSKKNIEIKRVKKLPCHMMVIGSHVRLERPHPPGEFGKRKEDVAIIYKDFPQLADECAKRFDSLWKNLS